MNNHDFAYVTVLSNETFLPGVKALLKSMKAVHASYPIGIMIPKSLEHSLTSAIEKMGILSSCNAFIIVADDLVIPPEVSIDRSHHWANTFFKLKTMSLMQFKKIIMIDCDVLVLKNMDELFQRESMSATSAGVCVHPDWAGNFTSGLVVMEPDKSIYEKLVGAIGTTVNHLHEQGKRAGDQDVVQTVFPDWSSHDNLLIHEKYNVIWYSIPHFCRYYHLHTDDIYMVHFTGAIKPWGYDKWYGLRELHKELRTQFKLWDWVRVPVTKSKRKKLERLLFKGFVWTKYWFLCK